jgi:hypothetical protein
MNSNVFVFIIPSSSLPLNLALSFTLVSPIWILIFTQIYPI